MNEHHRTRDTMNGDNYKTPFREIGRGDCGSVWAVDRPGPSYAMKFHDGSRFRSISNDSMMHQRIEEAVSFVRESQLPDIADLANGICIPQYRALIAGNDHEWWKTRLPRLPAGREPCNTLISERIPPFERLTRELIIQAYCPEELRQTILHSRNDEDCILRCYLGRPKQHKLLEKKQGAEGRKSNFTGFTLRNLPLTVQMMNAMGLDMLSYTDIMADTLAILHWQLQVDAGDIEFVLAPPRTSFLNLHPGAKVFDNAILGKHCLWLLDFDCVGDISMDEYGVEQAIKKHKLSDPYYPKPGRGEQFDVLWVRFVARYLGSSMMLVPEEHKHLVTLMMDGIERVGMESAGRLETIV